MVKAKTKAVKEERKQAQEAFERHNQQNKVEIILTKYNLFTACSH